MDSGNYSQHFIVSQSLFRQAAVPAAFWDFAVGRDDVQRVVDEVVLQDPVVGCAGGQRRRRVHLKQTRSELTVLSCGPSGK